MTITLSPEIEEAVSARAREQGTTPEWVVNDGLRMIFVQGGKSQADSPRVVQLKDHGIGPEQAAELRATLASFAAEWDQPEMNVYDDYDVARSRLEAR